MKARFPETREIARVPGCNCVMMACVATDWRRDALGTTSKQAADRCQLERIAFKAMMILVEVVPSMEKR